ncbi:hypothetical protein EON66_09150 [archaeon]|nr:MAG: hypothetical protein EON66_09150 [archaeon]
MRLGGPPCSKDVNSDTLLDDQTAAELALQGVMLQPTRTCACARARFHLCSHTRGLHGHCVLVRTPHSLQTC